MDDHARRLIAEAVALAGRREYGPEAERVNRQIVELLPDDIPSRNRLAQILDGREDIEGAIAMCRAVFELDPDNAIARRRLAVLTTRKPTPPFGDPPHPPHAAIDPADPEVAERIIRSIYPDETELRYCLQVMVKAIKQVDQLSDCWMISLLPRRVRLNVSKLTVVTLLPGTHKAPQYASRLSLLAQTSLVPMDVQEVALAVSGEVYPPPLIASHLNWVDLPSNRLPELVPRCAAAHRAAVDVASEFGRTPFKNHSRGVVTFVNRMLGERIVGP